jgi:hypothetical protein
MAGTTETTLNHKPNLKLAFTTPVDAREISDVWYECFSDEFIRKMFPHTPSVQQWWDDANTSDMLTGLLQSI